MIIWEDFLILIRDVEITGSWRAISDD